MYHLGRHIFLEHALETVPTRILRQLGSLEFQKLLILREEETLLTAP